MDILNEDYDARQNWYPGERTSANAQELDKHAANLENAVSSARRLVVIIRALAGMPYADTTTYTENIPARQKKEISTLVDNLVAQFNQGLTGHLLQPAVGYGTAPNQDAKTLVRMVERVKHFFNEGQWIDAVVGLPVRATPPNSQPRKDFKSSFDSDMGADAAYLRYADPKTKNGPSLLNDLEKIAELSRVFYRRYVGKPRPQLKPFSSSNV